MLQKLKKYSTFNIFAIAEVAPCNFVAKVQQSDTKLMKSLELLSFEKKS
jgi:hypothetical protein